jgi:transposase
MDVFYPKCAGLDVHKDSVVACTRVLIDGRVQQTVRTYDTTTKGLLTLADWLEEQGCTHIAMEATGVYWKPVWHILDGSFELVLANASHVRNVPGRKTDVNDATWIADLLAHGLIRASFVPPVSIQQLRDLTRTRKQLVRQKAQHVQRIQRVLEDANFKLTGVLTDILGQSGRAILEAIIDSQSDPERLADLINYRVKASRAARVEGLRGNATDHHRFLLRLHLNQVHAADEAIAQLDSKVGTLLEPLRTSADLLTTIPGVSDIVAQVVIAEIGVDMHRFPTAGHLLSWAGLCPRNDESAGKRRSTRVRDGAPWLKTTLVQAAWCAARTKGTYLRAQFQRLKSRRGPKKAVVAVAASILKAIYFMLRDGVAYQDLGANHFDRRDRDKMVRRLVHRLETLGCTVQVIATA